MIDDPQAITAEWIDSDSYLGQQMKRITYQCPLCDHVFTRTYKAEPKIDPKCPSKSCGDKAMIAELSRRVDNLTRMLESGVAPPQIGNNPRVKAVDVTADVVMKDHRLTDLKDNIRPGETMAPKLPGQMQKAADSFFSGGASAAVGSGQPVSRMQKRMQALGQRAIAGGMREMSISPNQVLPKTRPAVVRQANAGYDSSRPTAEGNRRI